MNRSEELEVWRKVNQTTTLKSLSEIILSLAGEDGKISGRTSMFDAKKMSYACLATGVIRSNTLTREFGIRQQALYIHKTYGQ